MDKKKLAIVLACVVAVVVIAIGAVALGSKQNAAPESAVETAEPTATPEPTPTPEPTATPKPTAAPEEAEEDAEETVSETGIDFSKADAVHDSGEFGGNAGHKVYEIDGHYYLKDGSELAKDENGNWCVLAPELGVADSITKEEIDASTKKAEDYLESGQALRDLYAYYAEHPDQPH